MTTGNETQFDCSRTGDIDTTTFNIRSTIGYRCFVGLTIVQVGNYQLGAKRQAFVCRKVWIVLIERSPIGHQSAIETRSIPGCHARFYSRICGSGECQV